LAGARLANLSSFLILLAVAWSPLAAESPPRIALVIDDMGYSLDKGQTALALPGDLTFAFLPHAPHSKSLSREAHRRHKEILLHLPMESNEDEPLDEDGLRLGMRRRHFYQTLLDDLDSLEHVVGVNNHMGSRLTQDSGAMGWLMFGLKSYGDLFFLDSLTTEESVAGKMAQVKGVPTASRDIFLDHERSTLAISYQMHKLVKVAKRQGYAIGIGHPYPETLQVLRRMLPNLKKTGVQLVPLSQLIRQTPDSPAVIDAHAYRVGARSPGLSEAEAPGR
jgi:polysaccharide deacetylase 2 family uncharacterized protein YibQ